MRMWLINSSIGRKLVMSISGLFLILFLLFHMSMNVAAIFSAEAYNMICAFLGANWYAVVGTKVLALGFIVHIVYAIFITIQNQRARGKDRYEVNVRQAGVSWSSKNMLVLGFIVVAFAGLHLYQFWAKMMLVELLGEHTVALGGAEYLPTDGAGIMTYYFKSPIYAGLYLLWFAALWFHLTHGFWSAIHTIGWNNTIWMTRLKWIANIFATVIFLGFSVVVVVYFLHANGFIHLEHVDQAAKLSLEAVEALKHGAVH